MRRVESAQAVVPVGIVILTWNSIKTIEGCIRAAQAEKPSELVVVDNGSEDGTVAFVKERFPSAEIIALNKNHGFSAGCNIGFDATRSPFVLFLNDDATLTPGYLQALLNTLENDSQAASAVGKLVAERPNGRFIDGAGIELCRYALRPRDRGHGEMDRGQYDQPRVIFGSSCAAALYRRTALKAAGLRPFDEELFAYYEDVDLAWRLNRRGWHHLYVPHAVAFHDRRTADGKPFEINQRAFFNRYVVWMKNESLWRWLTYAPIALTWETVRCLRRAYQNPGTFGDGFSPTIRRLTETLQRRWRWPERSRNAHSSPIGDKVTNRQEASRKKIAARRRWH